MSKLTNNERVLLDLVCHLNDSVKYLTRAVRDQVPNIEDDMGFEKACELHERTDRKIKKFLSSLDNFE